MIMETKVKELIEQLKQLDPEAIIVTNNGITNMSNGDKIKITRNRKGYMIY